MTWESPIIAFDAIYFLTKNKAEAWEEIIVCIKQIWKEWVYEKVFFVK